MPTKLKMALIVHSSSTFPSKNPRLLLRKPHLHSLSKPTKLSIKSQDSSTEPPISSQPTDDTSSTLAPPPKNLNSTGLGFGSSSASSNSNPVTTKKKQKGKRERASIIRRAPVEKPKFISQQEDESKLTTKKKQKGEREGASIIRRAPVEKPKFISQQEDESKLKEQGKNESVFLLTWNSKTGALQHAEKKWNSKTGAVIELITI